MNMRQIEGFCYLAQTLNFSKAAEMLYITQPAFSRMIVSLEEELECKLFVRSKIKPQLTPAGEQIYKHMKTILRDYEDIRGIAQLAAGENLGRVRIGMLDNGLTEIAKTVIASFHSENEHIILEIKEYSEVEMFHALDMEWIDVAFIVHFPQIFREKTEGLVIEESRECVVVHKDNPLSRKTEIAYAELKDEPFIMLRETKSEMGYSSIMTTCLDNGFSPNIAMKVDSVGGALSCVACNLGCILLTDALKPLASDTVCFVPVKNGPIKPIRMVWKKENQTPSCILFREFVKAQVGRERISVREKDDNSPVKKKIIDKVYA